MGIFSASADRKPQDPPLARPIPNSYWVIPGRLLAGEHPVLSRDAPSSARLQQLSSAGINFYLDLTEPGEVPAYQHLLPTTSEYRHFPISDCGVPSDPEGTRAILASMRAGLVRQRVVYVHCRAGIGRTGLIIGCFLAEDEANGAAALKQLNRLWRQSARSQTWRKVPQTAEQANYIRCWPNVRATG